MVFIRLAGPVEEGATCGIRLAGPGEEGATCGVH